MELSIIILNYKTKDLTVNCINSIVEQYKKELDEDKFEIIVVDNASEDGSFEAILKLESAISWYFFSVFSVLRPHPCRRMSWCFAIPTVC